MGKATVEPGERQPGTAQSCIHPWGRPRGPHLSNVAPSQTRSLTLTKALLWRCCRIGVTLTHSTRVCLSTFCGPDDVAMTHYQGMGSPVWETNKPQAAMMPHMHGASRVPDDPALTWQIFLPVPLSPHQIPAVAPSCRLGLNLPSPWYCHSPVHIPSGYCHLLTGGFPSSVSPPSPVWPATLTMLKQRHNTSLLCLKILKGSINRHVQLYKQKKAPTFSCTLTLHALLVRWN